MAVEYHLLKRERKDRHSGKKIKVFYIGFLQPNGKGYVKMKSTDIKVGTKEAERQASKLAQQLLS